MTYESTFLYQRLKMLAILTKLTLNYLSLNSIDIPGAIDTGDVKMKGKKLQFWLCYVIFVQIDLTMKVLS